MSAKSKPQQAARRVHTADGGPLWKSPDGKPVSCHEKIKVLNQNIGEIAGLARDAMEDAVLMGCDPDQVRDVLHQLVDSLTDPYAKK
jgi:hypothetical protein